MRTLILLLSVCLLNISCSKDEVSDGSLEGEWVLTNVSCFCGFGEDYDFTTTQISFDTNNNKVTIENNGEFTFIKESGTYSYSGNGNRIVIDGERSYTFSVLNATLEIVFEDNPNIADDEVSYSFRR